MLDQPLQGEDQLKKWTLGLFRPFFLSLFNEQWLDYSQLIMEEAKRQLGKSGHQASEPALIEVSRDTLIKKFDLRLR